MIANFSSLPRILPTAAAALMLGLVLLLPANAGATPFQWPDEPFFKRLEREGRILLARLEPAGSLFPEKELARLELLQFEMGTIAAAHGKLLLRLQRFANELRQRVLPAAAHWQAEDEQVRQILYRLIYGGRAAVEEAWLQSEPDMLPSLLQLADAAPATPSTIIEGVRVHSGDILLSRAGAPTSALISRGNDFRGNFSHVALLHVDAETNTPRIIESHIERGVVISTAKQYLEDTKQRIVVLRLRSGHPKLAENPSLPHAAASAMLARAKKRRVPYDFAMDYRNDDKLFCAEVVYHAYRHADVELWRSKTTMSQPGLRAWLGGMGVKSFETLAPSDIEYDPQLVAVAEWRDLEVLREDRIDSAMMDALLEESEKGLRLGYPAYKLPLAAGAKLWGGIGRLIGLEPTIPPGMSVATALRVDSLVKTIFPLLRQRLRKAAADFRKAQGYSPPYWSLLQLARRTLARSLPELSPQLVRR